MIMTKGWHNEPGRHSLAARGVKTTYLGKLGISRGAETVDASGNILIFPKTGDRFLDAARFEHFLDDLGMAGFDEGRDWDYAEGDVFGIIILNPDIIANEESLDAFERWGYKIPSTFDAKGIKSKVGQAGKHLYYFYFGMWHPYSLSTWVNKANWQKVNDLRKESLLQADGSPTGAFDLVYDRHKQLLDEYYATDDPDVRKSLEDPIGVSVSVLNRLSPDAMME